MRRVALPLQGLIEGMEIDHDSANGRRTPPPPFSLSESTITTTKCDCRDKILWYQKYYLLPVGGAAFSFELFFSFHSKSRPKDKANRRQMSTTRGSLNSASTSYETFEAFLHRWVGLWLRWRCRHGVVGLTVFFFLASPKWIYFLGCGAAAARPVFGLGVLDHQARTGHVPPL